MKNIFWKIKHNLLKIKSIKIIFLNNKLLYNNKKYINKYYQINIQNNFNSKQNIFNNIIHLHKQKCNKQYIINILPQKKILLPIYIIYLHNNYKKDIFYINKIIINKYTHIDLIEHYFNLCKDKISYFFISQINIKKHVYLNYLKIINSNNLSKYITYNEWILHNYVHIIKNIFFLNANLIKETTFINTTKKNILNINSLSLLQKKNKYKYKIFLLHKKDNTISNQLHKSLILKKSTYILHILIKIFKQSNNTITKLTNNNIHIKNIKNITIKPELKIYNKNSICKHHCTIKQLNKHYIFYLLSRGLKKNQIIHILSIIFCKTIIYKINNKNIEKNIKNIIKYYINKNYEF